MADFCHSQDKILDLIYAAFRNEERTGSAYLWNNNLQGKISGVSARNGGIEERSAQEVTDSEGRASDRMVRSQEPKFFQTSCV